MAAPICQGELHLDRQRRTHVHILLAALKSVRGGAEVIVVVRNVVEFEVSLRVGLDALVIVGNRVLNFHGRARNGGAGGVEHRPRTVPELALLDCAYVATDEAKHRKSKSQRSRGTSSFAFFSIVSPGG